MTSTCPHCHSPRIVHGELRTDASGHDVGSAAFHLPATRDKFFLFSEPCVYPEDPVTVCLECGLLWTRVDPKEVRRLHEKYGEKP